MSAGFADLLALQGVWLGGRRSRAGGSQTQRVTAAKRRRYDAEALLLVLLSEDGRRFTPLI